MRRFDQQQIGVAQGQVLLFSDFKHDGEMWTGAGPREILQDVRFDTPFRDPPVVHVAVSMWDTDAGSNQRGDVTAVDVTAEGYTLRFGTWGDTRIARLRILWTAIGAARDPDLWDVD
ncbi:hypothetical protein EKE94_16655 [Mesobaculum littorinae]|uniref:H-type lectin domain-containing protein n=1 Tax=Mesobaculum littorinae TaxID=2486419 RepID=A0A438AE27_9RHOB|nr:H-type lectin domain-containing protein [Mesobaculum littorinae]RVV96963.1 hypothetical protein EKE94_16655 [Mesobaculum littorinae]